RFVGIDAGMRGVIPEGEPGTALLLLFGGCACAVAAQALRLSGGLGGLLVTRGGHQGDRQQQPLQRQGRDAAKALVGAGRLRGSLPSGKEPISHGVLSFSTGLFLSAGWCYNLALSGTLPFCRASTAALNRRGAAVKRPSGGVCNLHTERGW